jgi:hypothetical protein
MISVSAQLASKVVKVCHVFCYVLFITILDLINYFTWFYFNKFLEDNKRMFKNSNSCIKPQHDLVHVTVAL